MTTTQFPDRALSVRAPWWWAILHAMKDIENRDWPTSFRGRVLLHASRWWKEDEGMEDCQSIADILGITGFRVPDNAFLQDGEGRAIRRAKADLFKPGAGCIVGLVEIVDCVDLSDSPWFFGSHGFVLRNPVAFRTPIPCKGALSFFKVPEDVREAARLQVEERHA